MRYFLVFLFIAGQLLAQEQDPKAKSILDELSKITRSYKTIQAEYVMTIIGKENKVIEKQNGKVLIKGEKFRLEIPGNVIVCDGKTQWNHNKDAGEVTIKNYDPSQKDQLNPNNIFTIYESGFKFKYEKEEKLGQNPCHLISLYPAENQQKKKYHTIKLYIHKTKKQVVQMVMLMKDGGKQIVEVKSFKTNLEIPDDKFIFDTKPFKADQIVDERS